MNNNTNAQNDNTVATEELTMHEKAAAARVEIAAKKERVSSGRGAAELSGTRLKYKADQSYTRKSGSFSVSYTKGAKNSNKSGV